MLDSPYRLTALTLASGLLAALAFLLADSTIPHRNLPYFVACFVIAVAVGMIGMYWSAHLLREGIRKELWSDEQLAPLRRVVDHPAWKWAMFALIGAMAVTLLQDRHHRIGYWPVLLLLQTQTQLGSAFARPKPRPATGAHIDWSNVAPVSSEHWGER